MAVLKVACPKCGQRVSGDDSFYGTSVECPVCTAKVVFPEKPGRSEPPPEKKPAAEPEKDDFSGTDLSWESGRPADSLEETGSIPLPRPPAVADRGPAAGAGEGSPILGVISMVVGIVTVVCLCLPGILLGPVAVVCGHMGLASSRRARVHPAPGENMALTGLILGYVGMAVSLVYLVMLAFPELPQNFRGWFGGSDG